MRITDFILSIYCCSIVFFLQQILICRSKIIIFWIVIFEKKIWNNTCSINFQGYHNFIGFRRNTSIYTYTLHRRRIAWKVELNVRRMRSRSEQLITFNLIFSHELHSKWNWSSASYLGVFHSDVFPLFIKWLVNIYHVFHLNFNSLSESNLDFKII